jgi:prefoldin alpha subunit
MEALEMARLRLENMSKEAEIIQMSLNEHIRAIETIKAYATAGDGKEILIPVGAGAFLPARSSGQDWAIVNIGTGVSSERKLDEAVTALEKSAEEIEAEGRKLTQNMRNLEKQASMLNQKVQELSAGQGAEPAPEPEKPQPKKHARKKDEEE